jgi:ribose transport system substrate-binding protein
MKLQWLAGAGLLPIMLMAGSAWADDSSYVAMAKVAVTGATKPAPPWTGPTTGPKAVPDKFIIFVNYDQRNSGGRGVGNAAAAAA